MAHIAFMFLIKTSAKVSDLNGIPEIIDGIGKNGIKISNLCLSWIVQ
jgi:hypothetical protein